MLDDRGHDDTVAAKQLDTRFARLLVCARGDDDEPALRKVAIVAGTDKARLCKGNAVVDIRSLAFRLFACEAVL